MNTINKIYLHYLNMKYNSLVMNDERKYDYAFRHLVRMDRMYNDNPEQDNFYSLRDMMKYSFRHVNGKWIKL
jgi:hypothetical protein